MTPDGIRDDINGIRERQRGENEGLPWYWILIIVSAVVGPFEAMHALNKARRQREERMKKNQRNKEESGETRDGKQADGPEAGPDHG